LCVVVVIAKTKQENVNLCVFVAVVVVVVAVFAVVAVVVAVVAVVAVVVVCCSQHRNEKMSIRVFAM
jgi:hypothetical protein